MASPKVPELTADRLRQLIHFDPASGKWTRTTQRDFGEALSEPKVWIDGTQHFTSRVKWAYLHGEWPLHMIRPGEDYDPTVEVKERTCKKCGTTKPIEDFPKARNCRAGYRWDCQACRSGAIAAWKKKTGWKPTVEAVERKKTIRVKPDRKTYRQRNLLSKYGLSPADYDKMLHRQGGVCALCQVAGRLNGTGTLSIDHCHETKLIRGLLCPTCNSALGMLGDTPTRLERVLAYVRGELFPGDEPRYVRHSRAPRKWSETRKPWTTRKAPNDAHPPTESNAPSDDDRPRNSG